MVLANTVENREKDDPLLVNFAINYDFGFVKPFFAAQYSEHFSYATGASAGEISGDFKKMAYLVGVTAPAAGGTFRAEIQYLDGEEELSGEDYDKQIYSIGYTYPLSKRTSVYGIAGAFWQDADWQEDDITAHEAIVGLMHRF